MAKFVLLVNMYSRMGCTTVVTGCRWGPGYIDGTVTDMASQRPETHPSNLGMLTDCSGHPVHKVHR
jgi:hypothetical protein